jgi:hypothetical protein
METQRYYELGSGQRQNLTRDNIASIHGILVFDESKSVHELDLGDLSCAVSVEMCLDLSFRSCS